MCDLLAACFSKPVTALFALRGFKAKERFNSHGWGLAWYPDRSVQVVKEPVRASESRLFVTLFESVKLRSEIFIAHVRRASDVRLALPSYMNTHPFWRELRGKAYVFAHNGSLKPGVKRTEFKGRFPLGRFKPIGGTGAEYVFCHLLDCIERNVESWRSSEFRWLHEKLSELNEYLFLNCAMSDGSHLFVYHDSEGYNGMALTFRRSPFPTIQLKMDEKAVLQEVRDEGSQGFVVATLSKRYTGKPVYLTDEEWVHLEPGELIALKKGEIVFSSRRKPSEATQTLGNTSSWKPSQRG
ncbi:MAG: class II glutamine amidotransferase [Candidatus Freyarchaeota archaeon]|nr:class II glutamine amidotransferase [Candidatus Jordarchaeia archaeon]